MGVYIYRCVSSFVILFCIKLFVNETNHPNVHYDKIRNVTRYIGLKDIVLRNKNISIIPDIIKKKLFILDARIFYIQKVLRC